MPSRPTRCGRANNTGSQYPPRRYEILIQLSGYQEPALDKAIRSMKPSISTSVLILHNHPSGDPTPSPEDVDLTRRLTAGVLMGIDVVDHIILGDARYCGLKEARTL